MEELISALNKASKSEKYNNWDDVLRDFDASPYEVNEIILEAIKILNNVK